MELLRDLKLEIEKSQLRIDRLKNIETSIAGLGMEGGKGVELLEDVCSDLSKVLYDINDDRLTISSCISDASKYFATNEILKEIMQIQE